MPPTDAAAADPITTSISLVDEPTPSFDDGKPATTTSATEPKPTDDKSTAEPEEKPKNADDLALELSRRTREASSSKKAADASKRDYETKSKQLDGYIERHKEFEGVIKLAKTEPLKFAERMAEATGLPIEVLIEAWTLKSTTGKARDLTPEERKAIDDRNKADDDKKAADDAKAKADGEKAVQT